jgi:hypothetical protein
MKFPKTVILENKESVGTFSVGAAPDTGYSHVVDICVARDGITAAARYYFSNGNKPKICAALDALKKAMLEEGAEEADIITIG